MSVFGECICEYVSAAGTSPVFRPRRWPGGPAGAAGFAIVRKVKTSGFVQRQVRERSAFVFCTRIALISDARDVSAFARSESLRLTSSGLSNNPPPGLTYPCDDKTGKCTFPPSSTGVHFWSKKWEIAGRPEQVNLKSRSRFPHLNSKEISV